jgi:UDP-N-acetylmuramoyl-L-alanyl-D-glutamate--2,6-diaminopimelate ligase
VRSDADLSLEVTGIASDSRRVEPGYLFAAIPGFKADGHDFVGQAASAGASVAMTSRWLESAEISQVQVDNVRAALAEVSANFYQHPSEKLRLVGITGTNGKSTTTYMLRSILTATGNQTALLGGVEYIIAGDNIPATRTTPESTDLQRMLAEGVAGGDSMAVLEVSSHGIDLYRAAALAFDVAVFTNLTRDHLDLHHDMESYYQSKRKLFFNQISGSDSARPLPVAVVNTDDRYGERLAEELREAGGEVVAFGASSEAGIRAEKIVYSGWETAFTAPAGQFQPRQCVSGGCRCLRPGLFRRRNRQWS